jgi:hypothetical protein
MADTVPAVVATEVDPNVIEVKLFNKWSFDDVHVFYLIISSHTAFNFEFVTFLSFYMRKLLITRLDYNTNSYYINYNYS